MRDYEEHLARWQNAGVLDAETASRIRAWESTDERPSGMRWQVLVALICGALLLTAGVALFVAAHWDRLGPNARLLITLSLLPLFHGIAIAVREKFDRLATVMHAVGTAAAGAAIALIGQIFNIQEHWPAAILLWALCAGAGWWFLRDQVQQIMTLLLVPAWMASEWDYYYERSHGAEIYLARILAVWAALYLTAFLGSGKKLVMGVLFAVSVLPPLYAVEELSNGWVYLYRDRPFVPLTGRILAWLLIAVVPLALAAFWNRKALPPVLAMVGAVAFLPVLSGVKVIQGRTDTQWIRTEPSIFSYVLVAALALFLAWWGVQMASKLLINYGLVCFAIVVLWFYFSDLMDKLDRSLGLIVLGLLFFAGGWTLERLRRRLVGSIESPREVEA